MKLTNLKIYFILILFNNFWFITSNWLNFWLKYMSLKEVGIIDAAAFLVGIMLEFPSGLISDKLGRKQTLLISQSLQLLGSLIITFSNSLMEIGVGFVIFQIGVAFYSGTIEAFGYEASRIELKEYTRTLTFSTYTSNFAYLTSLLVGGYLYSLNTNIPNILFTLNFLVGYLFTIFITTKFVDKPSQDSSSEHLKFKNFNLFTILLFVALMSLSFSFDYGFIKLVILDNFSNLDTNYYFIFFATILSIPISSWLISRFSNYNVMLLLSITLFLFTLLLNSISFIPLFFVLSFLAIFIYQLSLKYINEKVADSQRAGAISIFNLFYKLPYVLIALILGYNLA